MLAPQDQLTELVRHLEDQHHVFAADPLLVTEKLQDEAGTPIQKLRRRAARIDRQGQLQKTLSKIDSRIKAIIIIMSVIWCVSGFLGLFALLQSNVVNFFYVLVCVLGVHTLMLAGWLLMTVINNKNTANNWFASLISPSYLIRSRDDVTSAAITLYEQQLDHSGMRWYVGKLSHQLWLATLTGMLFAIIFLLIVRQYSFSWESTLLSDQALITLTHALGWLPSLVGFSVPDEAAIIQSRLLSDTKPLAMARQWASLLIGSLLMYGIVPRAIAWLFCAVMFARRKMRLDITLPYYQNILNFWQRRVIDHDDFTPAPVKAAPKAAVSSGKKLVALLEYPAARPDWWQAGLADDAAKDFGIIDDREDLARLLDYLKAHPVQVLLGIHTRALPDRGVLRKLDQISAHSQHGLIVQLLSHDDASISDSAKSERYQQWQRALSDRQIGLIDDK